MRETRKALIFGLFSLSAKFRGKAWGGEKMGKKLQVQFAGNRQGKWGRRDYRCTTGGGKMSKQYHEQIKERNKGNGCTQSFAHIFVSQKKKGALFLFGLAFLLCRQSRYTYWYNDLYSMTAEAYVLQKV